MEGGELVKAGKQECITTGKYQNWKVAKWTVTKLEISKMDSNKTGN